MKIVYKSKYVTVEYSDKDSVMIATVKPETEFRSSEEMRIDMEKSAEMVEIHKPLYYLSNQKENKYLYKVDEQKWIAKIFGSACIKVGLKKLGMVYPEELLGELALEQTVEEGGNPPFETKYFTDKDKALEWFAD